MTGAGRGLGRAHALELAAHGAWVVVNDRGTALDGSGHDPGPARAVAAEITGAGGRAVATSDDAADWDGGRRLVEAAVEAFGRLDGLVLSAGNLRDRYLVTMGPEDWDEVLRVHLRGHFVPLRWAAGHWRARARAGEDVAAAAVLTTSLSGLAPNPGQANYGAAKAAIAALCQTAAAELDRYGVRVNAVAPLARTRLTTSTPGLAAHVAPPGDPAAFDAWDPARAAPLVAWLLTPACPLTGQVLGVHGATVTAWSPWAAGPEATAEGGWDLDGLARAVPDLVARAGATR